MGFTELHAVLETLATVLLPALDETQPLDETQRIKVRAYLVLAYAEIEGYLEELCRARAQRIGELARAQTIHAGLLTLSLFYADDLKGQHVPASDVERVAAACIGLFEGRLLSNHSIKGEALTGLIRHLGIDSETLATTCPDLLIALDALASLRGPTAHLGGAALQQDVYPSNAKEGVTSILDQLPCLEALVAIP